MAYLIKRNKNWTACFIDKNGKTIRKSTKIKIGEGKRAEKKSKEEAQRLADLMEQQNKGNMSLASAISVLTSFAKSQGDAISFAEYYKDYSPKGKEQNQSNAKRALELFMKFLEADANQPLDNIKKRHIENFCLEQLQRIGVGTVKIYKAHLSAFFNNAIQNDAMIKNPCNGVQVLAMGRKEDNTQIKRLPFTSDEVKLILDKFPPVWVDMVKFCLWTGGQRIGDVACLRWEQINFETNLVRIKTMKTGKVIDIPLCDDFKERLEEMKESINDEKEIYVMPDMARSYLKHKGGLSTVFTNLLKTYGIISQTKKKKLNGDRKEISQKSFHSLRHFIVTTLRSSNNVSADVARAIVGHDSEDVERAYSTPSNEVKKQAMQIVFDSLK